MKVDVTRMITCVQLCLPVDVLRRLRVMMGAGRLRVRMSWFRAKPKQHTGEPVWPSGKALGW